MAKTSPPSTPRPQKHHESVGVESYDNSVRTGATVASTKTKAPIESDANYPEIHDMPVIGHDQEVFLLYRRKLLEVGKEALNKVNGARGIKGIMPRLKAAFNKLPAHAKKKTGKAAQNRLKRERQAVKRTAAKDRKEATAEAAKPPPFDGAEAEQTRAEEHARPRPWFSRGHKIAAGALVALCLVAGGGAYGLDTAGLAALGRGAFDSLKPGTPVGKATDAAPAVCDAVMPARPRLVSCLTSP